MSKVRRRLGLKFTEKSLHPRLLLCNIYNYSPKSLCSCDSYRFWSAYQSILLQYLFHCSRISPSSTEFHQWISSCTAVNQAQHNCCCEGQKRWCWENVTGLGKLEGTKLLLEKHLKYIGCCRIRFVHRLNGVTDCQFWRTGCAFLCLFPLIFLLLFF